MAWNIGINHRSGSDFNVITHIYEPFEEEKSSKHPGTANRKFGRAMRTVSNKSTGNLL